MNEKEFLQKIKKNAECINPPESLQPDAIEQRLRRSQGQSSVKANKKKTKIYRQILRYGSLAAVFVLAVTVAFQSAKLHPPKERSDSFDPSELSAISPAESTITAPTEDAAKSQTGIQSSNIPSSLEDVYNTLYDAFYYTEEEFYPGLGARLYGANDTGATLAEDGERSSSTADAYFESADRSIADAAANGDSRSVDYSKTNTQELNVDEGDIVKTDGQYIYILREDLSLAVIEANSGLPQLVSLTDLPQKNSGAIHEMYLDGSNLHVILTETITELNHEETTYYPQTTRQTVLLTYDISDRTSPSLIGQVTQEGSYSDSRKNGPYIYLFTRYIPDIRETYEESTVAPLINGVAADASDFYLPETLTDNACLVISSVDASVPDQILDSKILVSGATNFYVSQNSIYIANENYSQEHLITELTKFQYEDGRITGVAAASVKGYLNNSFSLNEYNGYLRVVSTYSNENQEEENGLFIFDENLNQISSIETLAEGEMIRSARFFGDTGYFVTFRQTDPLFSVDLSDPEKPQILGELKISGFSSYLHFYGEDQLLGIGYEANEETGEITGIKLSMFDISDPANVTETNRCVIDNITWCPAIEDYKAMLVQPEKNLIGFYCDNRYLVFSYEKENGFTQELVYDFFSDNLTGQADYYNMRGLYIEDMLYLAGNTFVVTFDMDDSFEKQNVLTIESPLS